MTADPTLSFEEFDLLRSPIGAGLTVIEASAGTGKTYSISHLVPRLLLEGVLNNLSELLLVTFTKDAARELADRVRRVLTQLAAAPSPDEASRFPHVAALRVLLKDPKAEERLRLALLDLDLLAVSTIHAFCQRTLQQEGALCGLPVFPELVTDEGSLSGPVLAQAWTETVGANPILAAMAVSDGWSPANVRGIMKALRASPHARLRPPPRALADLLQEITRLQARLQDAGLLTEAKAKLAVVTKWNKKQSSEGVEARLDCVARGDLASLEFWQALRELEALPEWIPARPHKELAATVGNVAWFAARAELQALRGQIFWSLSHQLAQQVLRQTDEQLRHHRLITQDGLIESLHQALHRSGAEGEAQSARLAQRLAKRYRVALIDESQDTDERQFAIFSKVFLQPEDPRSLVLVGDPKQAIYRFRGADLSTYLKAREKAAKGYKLTHTHRAPQPLVQVVNALFGRTGAFHHRDMRFFPATSALKVTRELLFQGKVCPRLQTWVCPSDATDYSAKDRCRQAISERIASTIVSLLENAHLRTRHADGRLEEPAAITPKDFAVLVAEHAQAQAMAEALRDRGVPAVVNSGADIFASEEAADLRLVLLALLEPRRVRRVRRALATGLLGFDAPTLEGVSEAGAREGEVDWIVRFERLHTLWFSRGLAALWAALEGPDWQLSHRLATTALTGERRVTNFRHLTDLLLDASRELAPKPEELVRWLGRQIAAAEERTDADERQLQLSSDRPAVQVVTMHKAKGLEYPLVFCPYLADPIKEPSGVCRLSAAESDIAHGVIANLPLVPEPEQSRLKELELKAAMEDRLRLGYVALTRAQVAVWLVSYSPSKKSDLGCPLDWILHGLAEAIAPSDYSEAWADSVRAKRDTLHRKGLEVVASKCEDPSHPAPAVGVGEPPEPETRVYTPADSASSNGEFVLEAEKLPVLPSAWRVTSFSTLTREKHAHGAVKGGRVPEQAASPHHPSEASLFFDAPGGAAVGTVVHDWIETWDFGPVERAALDAYLAPLRLPTQKEGRASWSDTLHDLFSRLREGTLPGCGDAPLHTLIPEAHGSEWHFHLPLAGPLSVVDLARCFERFAPSDQKPYAAILASLPEEHYRGLLQGFIDRLLKTEAGWGVIDWKTNRLGDSLSDYNHEGLLRCAMDSHYLLQTHLYLVALRRYLRLIGQGEMPLLGAWLVFVRATQPGTTRGVLHIKPPETLLDAIDSLFARANPVLA